MAASRLFDSHPIGQIFTAAFCPFCLHFAARFAWSWVAILPTPARSFCQIRGGHVAPSGAAILPRCRGGRSFLFPIVANKRDSAIYLFCPVLNPTSVRIPTIIDRSMTMQHSPLHCRRRFTCNIVALVLRGFHKTLVAVAVCFHAVFPFRDVPLRLLDSVLHVEFASGKTTYFFRQRLSFCELLCDGEQSRLPSILWQAQEVDQGLVLRLRHPRFQRLQCIPCFHYVIRSGLPLFLQAHPTRRDLVFLEELPDQFERGLWVLFWCVAVTNESSGPSYHSA